MHSVYGELLNGEHSRLKKDGGQGETVGVGQRARRGAVKLSEQVSWAR